jgi:metal-responsive CopG/Arc/MetJ family transcriptional regulator
MRLTDALHENITTYYSEVDRLAATEHRTKSEIIKDALRDYLASHAQRHTSYELGEELFGVAESGESDRSGRYKQRLKQKLGEKHSH